MFIELIERNHPYIIPMEGWLLGCDSASSVRASFQFGEKDSWFSFVDSWIGNRCAYVRKCTFARVTFVSDQVNNTLGVRSLIIKFWLIICNLFILH